MKILRPLEQGLLDTSIQENALGKRKVEFSGNWFKFSGQVAIACTLFCSTGKLIFNMSSPLTKTLH